MAEIIVAGLIVGSVVVLARWILAYRKEEEFRDYHSEWMEEMEERMEAIDSRVKRIERNRTPR